MGIIKGIEEWQEQQGENVGDFAQNTLNKVGGFICGLRRKYPNSFFDRSFGRGLANSICANYEDAPLLPQEGNFSGGQCEDVLYNVTVTFDRRFNNNTTRITETTKTYGAIRSIELERNPPDIGNLLYIVARGEPGERVPGGNGVISVGGVGFQATIVSIQVEREDQGFDGCGDIDPTFPPDPVRDSDDFSTTVEVCEYADDGTSIYCEDVSIQLDEKDKYDFPVCVTVDGKKICLDADGWSIEDAPEEEEEKEEEEFDEIEVLEAVTVTVNELPTKFNKRITRENAKDTEIFAGYLAWSKVIDGSEFFYPAIPIRKEKNIFIPPEDVQTYSVYYNFNLSGTVKEIKKKIKVPKQTENTNDTI